MTLMEILSPQWRRMFRSPDTVDLDDVIYSIEKCKNDTKVNQQTSTGLKCIASLEKDGDNKLVMTLSEPNTELMSLLTLAILPADYDKQDTAPIGTGPYKYVSRTAQESVELEKFADYWGTPGNIDKVTYKINEKTEGLVMGLESGALDLVSHLSSTQVAELNKDNFNIEQGEMNLVQALYLNNETAPFDNELRAFWTWLLTVMVSPSDPTCSLRSQSIMTRAWLTTMSTMSLRLRIFSHRQAIPMAST